MSPSQQAGRHDGANVPYTEEELRQAAQGQDDAYGGNPDAAAYPPGEGAPDWGASWPSPSPGGQTIEPIHSPQGERAEPIHSPQGRPGVGVHELQNPLKVGSIAELLTAILNVLIVLAVPIIVFFIIYAGFLFVTARGNEQQLSNAKRALLYAIIGGVIIIGAVAIAEIIKNVVAQFSK